MSGVGTEQVQNDRRAVDLVFRRAYSPLLERILGHLAHEWPSKPAGVHIYAPNEEESDSLHMNIVRAEEMHRGNVPALATLLSRDGGRDRVLQAAPSLEQAQRVGVISLWGQGEPDQNFFLSLRLALRDMHAAKDERSSSRQGILELCGSNTSGIKWDRHEPVIDMLHIKAGAVSYAYREGLIAAIQRQLGLPLHPKQAAEPLPIILRPAEFPTPEQARVLAAR